ncbi:uncharacterized protein Dsimw501_GD27656 [Drosophila simulans]|uniref:Uncharacterized protein n=1 Tax=Drosophila simulans TaxID=7240 RepID=A0A0J9RUR4_DROSI|nr:uncharacterized protein Dsimw501_GD27656 [Drosophila simulans]
MPLATCHWPQTAIRISPQDGAIEVWVPDGGATNAATHDKHATKTEADINQTSGGGGQKGTRPRPRPSSMAMSLCHIIAGDVVLCCWLGWLGLGWS